MEFTDLVRDLNRTMKSGELDGWIASSIQCGNGAMDRLKKLALQSGELQFPTKPGAKNKLLGLTLLDSASVPDNTMVVVCANGSALMVVNLPDTPPPTDTGKEK